jgi:hypothetical protein
MFKFTNMPHRLLLKRSIIENGMGRHVPFMGGVRNTHKILSEKLNRRDHADDGSMVGRMIL